MKLIWTVAWMTVSAFAAPAGSWTGVVTDSMCVKNHAMMTPKQPDDACVKACVKSNPSAYKYILFDGKTSFKLSNQQLPEQFAGKKVLVKGTLFEKTGIIKVDSIEAAR
jgi:hypothetical protein